MIKAALIGCGKISSAHLHAFETIDDASIVAACDLSEANLKHVCDLTGATPYTDYKKMIDELKGNIDFAIITLPHGLHGEATCYCAEHGVNVFLEKPMGISSEDCRNMIECCKKNNVMLWIGHLQRYMPANVYAKKLIESGELGELVSFHETRNMNYFSDDRPRWFLTKKMSGGGIMMNLGAHCLDKMKYFTDSDIAEIHGNVHIREGYDCEDSGQAFVKMANGVTGTLNLIGHVPAGCNTVSLYLTKGEIRLPSHCHVSYCGADGVFKEVDLEHVPGMTYQIQDVCNVLRQGKTTPSVTGEYGLDVIHAVKRLYGDEE